jgi:hypothetical protein
MSAAESPDELLARLAAGRTVAPPAHHFPVVVTGGRDHNPSREELNAFWAIFDRIDATELHHGNARGVDLGVAGEVRRSRPEVPVIPHPADWDTHGKAAGPIRNQAMLLTGLALIAFPGGRGTEHCKAAAARMGRPVFLIEDEVDRQRLDIERETVSGFPYTP